ncbi:type II secretion system protein GspL [Undibacterium cyanobacteriorum]|uniref:Type II secretion system protein GspL n=1 Tax=Undibacterium cyanobacteriorum TaxID=3073561 RepID=A0ABY9RDZ4_9BURK|nr:type II secretion system protein GspL [Undibacterium sp. 20NA77.5]WMW79093.1 type II secretion system protein GspL [Undibacterium sp. 20NA77.5]
MASTLFIQIPPRVVVEEQSDWRESAFAFCLASTERHLQQHGRQNLQDLISIARSASQVVLLLASSDVALFSVEVPPMSPQKLKAALPNLLEERVLEDTADLIFASTPIVDGQCTVAAVQRAWMESLYALVSVLEPRKVAAFPLAFGLPLVNEMASVLLEPAGSHGSNLLVSIKTNAAEVAGLALQAQEESVSSSSLLEILKTVSILSKGLPLELALDNHLQHAFDGIDETHKHELQIVRQFNADWSTKISSEFPHSLNLLAELVAENSVSFDWPKWRWSIGLAAAILLCGLFGLNWEAYQLRSEATALNASLRTNYQQLFPNETGLRDPILQLQQKINQSKKLAGQSTDDDFLVLSGQLALAWQSAHPQQQGAPLASMEYRERALFIKPKNSNDIQLDALRSALREQGLKIDAKDGLYKVSRNEGDLR